MDPVAENVSTHCLKSLVVLSLENGRECVCGKEGFLVCQKELVSEAREPSSCNDQGTSQEESIPKAATLKFKA